MKTDLIEIFQTIRAAMNPYETLGFTNRLNTDEEYDLWSEKNVIIADEKKSETYFAGLKINKNHVDFYFMPDPAENKNIFDQDLLNFLHESSHFQISELNEVLVEQIAEALNKGYKLFKNREWV